MPQDNILANILPSLANWWTAIVAILTLAGFALFLSGLLKLANQGRGISFGSIFLTLLAGILLINLPAFLDSLALSLFGEGSVQSLSYKAPDHPARFYIQFAVYLVALVGLVGIGRGLILLKNSPERPGLMGRALVHIFGGILCVNLVTTLKFMAQSLGGDAMDIVLSIFG
ncbi:MAG: hypothetical protein LBO66_08220 [Deltaproteobacteria bacterium]|jgi:hypothetical protein|nr:hypothetical protein [Deltaproteobacteria bacterium]